LRGQGDIKKLIDDVKTFKPTIFVAVPRVLERIQSVILDEVKKWGWIVTAAFNYFLNRKMKALSRDPTGDPAKVGAKFFQWQNSL
jgi:long-chain acyl-CoA synthetase